MKNFLCSFLPLFFCHLLMSQDQIPATQQCILTVKTFPAGVEVFRDGVPVSVTPCEFFIDQRDTIEIDLRMEGYHDFHTFVAPVGRDTVVVSHRMIPSFGYISVASDPPGANITIDTAAFYGEVSRFKVQPLSLIHI